MKRKLKYVSILSLELFCWLDDEQQTSRWQQKHEEKKWPCCVCHPPSPKVPIACPNKRKKKKKLKKEKSFSKRKQPSRQQEVLLSPFSPLPIQQQHITYSEGRISLTSWFVGRFFSSLRSAPISLALIQAFRSKLPAFADCLVTSRIGNMFLLLLSGL